MGHISPEQQHEIDKDLVNILMTVDSTYLAEKENIKECSTDTEMMLTSTIEEFIGGVDTTEVDSCPHDDNPGFFLFRIAGYQS